MAGERTRCRERGSLARGALSDVGAEREAEKKRRGPRRREDGGGSEGEEETLERRTRSGVLRQALGN